MNPESFRLQFRSSLERWFRIDEWSLGLPEPRNDVNRPASVAREKPITEIDQLRNVLGHSLNYSYQISQKFNYQVLYRLSNTLKYEQVLLDYRSPFETQLVAFSSYLIRSPGCLNCTEIRDIKTKVSSPELRQGDWLLSGQVEGLAIYESDPINTVKSPLFTP